MPKFFTVVFSMKPPMKFSKNTNTRAPCQYANPESPGKHELVYFLSVTYDSAINPWM